MNILYTLYLFCIDTLLIVEWCLRDTCDYLANLISRSEWKCGKPTYTIVYKISFHCEEINRDLKIEKCKIRLKVWRVYEEKKRSYFFFQQKTSVARTLDKSVRIIYVIINNLKILFELKQVINENVFDYSVRHFILFYNKEKLTREKTWHP